MDVSLRLVRNTKAHRKARRQAQWTIAILIPVLATINVGPSSLPELGVAMGVGVAAGLLCSVIYGYYHDWHVRNHTRQLLGELHGGANSMQCEVELRADKVWVKQDDVELSFAWRKSTRIHDREDGIELWFDQGLVLVRNRAFADQNARHDFRAAAEALAAAAE